MKSYQVFRETALTNIKPLGWLEAYLWLQRDGLTGHLENAGFPFDNPAVSWTELRDLGRDFHFWGHYEQNAYWIDGMIRCAGLLRDPFLMEKAGCIIRHVLSYADEDGYLGPRFIKKTCTSPDLYTRWSHAIFFRALAAYYEITGEEEVLRALERHYLESPYDHSTGRNVCNIESLVWLYEKTGNRKLKQLAEDTWAEMERKAIFPDESKELTPRYLLREDFADCHGVSFCEVGKLGAVLYRITGKEYYLEVSKSALRKLERYSMLIDGVPSSAEFMHGKSGLDSHETCVITDFMWMAGCLLIATGDAAYGDMIEKAAFNALPGAVGGDFKSLQYFSSPNQVIASAHSNHNLLGQGLGEMAYRPNPATECCPGNVNRAMPNYAARMWMETQEEGIAAVLYGPSEVSFACMGVPVKVTEDTEYPFRETVRFEIHMGRESISFGLKLRIPSWCKNAYILINGEKQEEKCHPGSFVTVKREYRDGDVVELYLPMEIRITDWPEDGAGIERGPLAYALQIKEDWRIDSTDRRSTSAFPAYDVYSDGPWNYALILPDKAPESMFETEECAMGAHPFTWEGAPVKIHTKARRLQGWKLRHETEVTENHIPFALVTPEQLSTQMKVKGDFYFTPALPSKKEAERMAAEEIEDVVLVPYGCARMRISVFPHVDK